MTKYRGGPSEDSSISGGPARLLDFFCDKKSAIWPRPRTGLDRPVITVQPAMVAGNRVLTSRHRPLIG
jgi:hypothetical protein